MVPGTTLPARAPLGGATWTAQHAGSRWSARLPSPCETSKHSRGNSSAIPAESLVRAFRVESEQGPRACRATPSPPPPSHPPNSTSTSRTVSLPCPRSSGFVERCETRARTRRHHTKKVLFLSLGTKSRRAFSFGLSGIQMALSSLSHTKRSKC